MPKKYTWEEPLILQGEFLNSILNKEVSEDQKIMVFAFGSVVFINTNDSSNITFFKYLKTIQSSIDLKNLGKYSDDYELRIMQEETGDIEFTDEYTIVPKFELFYPELISVVIAKSVALEKSEEQLEKILDVVEDVIDRFENKSLFIGNKQLVKTTSKLVRHEYNTIAYIMILDKPDITWSNSLAAEFYDQMSEFFELNDRYEISKKKADILNNIMTGFYSMGHSMRSLFLEWLIVLLIVAEIVVMLLELWK